MTSIYEHDIYSNGKCSGIFVWHFVYHVPQNKKLQSVTDRQNLVQEFCYLRVPRMTPAGSAELPSISALIAEDKCGHWLISTASLNLCVGAALPLALATGE